MSKKIEETPVVEVPVAKTAVLDRSFAINKLKLQRAINAAGPGADTEKVKAIYVSYGGLLAEDAPTFVTVQQNGRAVKKRAS